MSSLVHVDPKLRGFLKSAGSTQIEKFASILDRPDIARCFAANNVYLATEDPTASAHNLLTDEVCKVLRQRCQSIGCPHVRLENAMLPSIPTVYNVNCTSCNNLVSYCENCVAESLVVDRPHICQNCK